MPHNIIMSSTPTSSSSITAPFLSTSRAHNHYFFNYQRRRHQIRRTLLVKSSHKPIKHIRALNNAGSFSFTGPPRSSNIPFSIKERKDTPGHDNGDILKHFGKHISIVLFWIVIGLFPIGGFQVPAMAAPSVASVVNWWRTSQKDESSKQTSHEYSEYTKKLLETVSRFLRTIEEVSSSPDEIRYSKKVESALQEVKLRKQELENEITSMLSAESRIFYEKTEKLFASAQEIELAEAQLLRDWLVASAIGKDENRIEELEEGMEKCVNEQNEIEEKIYELEDQFKRKETMALSIGVRELNSIQRECELLVQSYNWNFVTTEIFDKMPNCPTKLSRLDIQEGLQTAQRQLWEQTILPSVLENEDIEDPFQQDVMVFAQRIKQTLEDSREMQRNLEADIRKNLKKFGNERRFLVNTPEGEIVKGFPEVESKWMFGGKETVVPKATVIHLFSGWKKWREEAKSDLKKELLNNEELGKKYVAQRQENILRDRDRVASKTWYNDERKTWEMDPVAAPYAVSRKIVDSARIRHDWGAMYITLKGDDKEYYIDLKKFEMLFQDFGGFDALYLRMIASGVATVTQVMWIPFYEMDVSQQLSVAINFSQNCFRWLLNDKTVPIKELILKHINIFHEDVLVLVVFPLTEFILPYEIRLQMGMAWPKYNESEGSPWLLLWQNEVEQSFHSRYPNFGFLGYLWFLGRSFIYVSVLSTIFTFLRKNLPSIPGFEHPRSYSPKSWKIRRLLLYTVHRYLKVRGKMYRTNDPVTEAFDKMKREKNPPIPLKDFSSIESMREEINEVVKFLQNPNAFQEMGARAPRGVLIVGDRGTGKTSLALAIAAEAKVPVVKIKPQALENEKKVGQSASNIRELFQTARDLAPIIIFVEDFDQFAGVRGKFVHTKKQDHEAFINQLLVELDGFQKQDGVVLMATTRNPKEIDEALRRPGRMDRTFYLHSPTQGEREKILRVSARNTMDPELIDFVDWRKVAEKTARLRPIELKLVPVALEGNAFKFKFLDKDELMTYCSWFATLGWIVPTWVRKTKIVRSISRILVSHLGLALTKEDFQNVVDLMEPYGQITDGIELMTPPLEWTRESKFPHAVWAAGRCLVAHLLPNFDVVENLWLEPSSWKGIGCTKITRSRHGGLVDGNVESRSYLEKKLVFCFGSYVASQLLLPYGEENFLSTSELKKARETATRMVIQHGWGPDDNQAIYHYGNATATLSMGENHRHEIAERVEKIYYLAYDKAKAMLQSNRQVLECIVEALLDFEILTGKDLERIVADNGGIFEKEPFFLSNVHVDKPVYRSLIENGNASSTALLSADN